MYKVFSVDLNNNSNVDLPEGYSVEGTLFSNSEKVVLLIFRHDPPQQTGASPRPSYYNYTQGIVSTGEAYPSTSGDSLSANTSGANVAATSGSGIIRWNY